MSTNDNQQHVVFIDSRVPDIQDLIDGAAAGTKVFVLDPASDGVQQIADILAANDLTDLASVSIVGHGSAGEIELGSGTLDDADLSDHAAALGRIGAALAPGGDLQLYACNTASGATGQQFIADLSQFAGGIEVQAATHDIGLTAGGENWTLDASTAASPAPAVAPFTAEALADFQGQLATTPTGQLFFRINQGNDVQLAAINDTGASATPTSIYFGGGFTAGTPQNLGLHTGNDTSVAVDTAAGLVFSIGVGKSTDTTAPINNSFDAVSVHSLTTGALIETIEFGPNSGDANIDDVVQALALDPFTNTLYVGDWGTDTAHTGVAKFTYNPSTGILTPFTGGNGSTSITTTQPNGASAVTTASGIYLFTSSQLTTPSTYTNANAFFLDSANNKLYYVNDDTGFIGGQFTSVNGVYVVNTNGPTFTTTELTSNGAGTGQFPVATGGALIGAHGDIVGLAVDVADGKVFFETTDTEGSANIALWSVNTTGANQTATKMTLPAGVTLSFAGQTTEGGDAAGLTFDASTKQLYLTNADNDTTVPDKGAIYQLQYVPATNSLTLVNKYDTAQLTGTTPATANPLDAPSATTFDVLPTLTTSGTTTHAGEQGANLTLLAATPTITDPDGNHLASATVQITAGTFSTPASDENSSADDHLTISSAHRGGGSSDTSGTISGTSISYSYSSATETLTLSGYDTLTDYQTALSFVQYFTTGDNPTNYGNNTSRTVTFQVNDGAVGNPSGANTTTTTLNIDAVNDAAVISVGAGNSASLALTETNAGLSGSHTLTVTDPDSLSQTISTSLVSHTGPVGSVSDATLATFFSAGTPVSTSPPGASGTVTYTFNSGTEAFNFIAAGQTLTLTYNIHDVDSANTGASLSTDQHVAVTIAGTNDAPVVTAGGTLAYTENQAATVISAAASVTDIDSPDFNLGSLTVSVTTNGHAEDQLSILTDATVTVVGSTVRVGGNEIGTINAAHTGANGASLEIDFDSTNATQAAVTTLMDHIAYANSSDDPSTAARTVTFAINDGDGIANGGVATASATSTVNITAVNDAPVNHVPGAQSVNEDAALVFNTANGNLISITDADVEGGSETVTLSVGHGALTLASTAGLSFTIGDGTADATMTFSGTLANINAALNGLNYQGTANFNGSDTLSVTVNDNGNTGTGGAQQDQDPVGIVVSPVNDAPTVVNGTSVALAPIDEDAAAPAGVTVSSLLSGHFSDALDAQTAAGGTGPNAFAGIAVTADAASAAQGHWQYLVGAVWNDISTSVSTASALLIDAQTQIRFLPGANFNGAPGSLTVHLIDDSAGPVTTGAAGVNLTTTGGTTQYSTGAVTIGETVNAVNDAPTFTGLDGTPSFTENGAAVVLDNNATVSDVDLDALGGGAGNYAGATLTLARDGGASGDDLFGSSGTLTLNTGTGNVQIGATTVGAFTETGGTLAITFNASATTTLVDNVLDQISYANTSNAPPASVQVDYTFSDGNAGAQGPGGPLTASGHVTVAITPTNDAPDLTPDSPTAVSYVTGQASPVGLFSNGLVTDPDQPVNFAGGKLIVDITVGEDIGHDHVALLASSPFTVGGGNAVMDGAVQIGTISSLGSSMSVTLGAGATPAEVDKLLEAFGFSTDSTGTTDRGVRFTFDDGGNVGGLPTLTDAVTQTVHVSAAAAASPTIAVTGTAVHAVEQTTPAISVLAAAPVITTDAGADPADTLASATVTISGSFVGSGDTLSVLDNGGATNVTSGALADFPNISVSVTTDANGNETLTLTGVDSTANYESVLADVQFLADSDNPTDFDLHTARILSWSVNDGTSDSAPASSSVTIDPLNDAPLNTVPGARSVNEDTALAFTGGNTISVSDPDNQSLSVTLSALHGTVTLGSITNVTVSGNGSGSVTIAGLTTDVDNALASLSYQGNANFNGPDTLSIDTSDGIAPATHSTVAITVNAVSDAPSGADHTVTTSQDTAYVFQTSDFGFSDTNDSPPDTFAAVKIDSVPLLGTLKDGASTLAANAVVSSTDIANHLLVFTPVAGQSGTNYASFTFQVEDSGTTANGGANIDPSPNTLTIDVAAAGAAPTITIGTIAGDDTVNAAEAAAGFAISGTTTSVEDNQTVTVTILDSTNAIVDTFTPTVSGNAWSASVDAAHAQGLADGSYTVKADVSNAANVAAPEASRALQVDETAPLLTVTGITPDTGDSPSDGITNTTPVTVSGTIDAGDANRTVTVFDGLNSLGAATLDGVGGWSLSGVTLNAGANSLTASATDGAGNTGTSAAFTATLDTTPPGQPTVALAHDTGALSNDGITSDPTLTFSAPAAGDTLLYKVDGGGFTTTVPVFATDHSADGPHTVSVEEQDAAGNISTAASLTFTLDTTAPTAPTVVLANDTGALANDGITSDPTLTFSAPAAGDTLLYKVDGGGFTTTVPVFATDHSADGPHTVSVEEQDAAGNISTAASLTFTLDTIAPAVTTVNALSASNDLGLGQSITFDLVFDGPIVVAGGIPSLTLSNGETATLTGSDATNLVFGYTVQPGDDTSDLTIAAVNPNGATIQDAAGNNADLTAAVPGVSGLQVDATAPTVTSVTAQPADGVLKAGGTVKLTVNVSEAVTVTGAPTLSLNDGGTATFDVAASIATALVFDYTVLAGENTSDLTVTGVNLAGGSIQDAAGNNADTAGAAVNPAGTLVVDTSAPGAPLEQRLALHAGTDTLSGAAEALSTVTVTLDGHALPTVNADAAGAWSLDTAALSLGAHSFTATATDAAGNVSASSTAFDIDVLAGLRADYFVDTVLGGDHILHAVVTDVATGGAPQTLTGVEALQFDDGAFLNAGADLNRIANFDGGRFDDVLFQHDGDGQLVFASMNDGAVTGFGTATAPIGSFVVGGTGDINGDGFADVFVQDPAHGTLLVAEQSGTGTPTWAPISTGLPADFKLVGAGDLNGDGFADAVVQQQSTGTVDYAAIVNGAFSSWQPVASNLGSFHVGGIGDVNGDGFADVVAQDQGGQNEIVYASMAGGVFSGWTQVAVAPGWQVAAVGDFNGDGNADVVIRDTAVGFNTPVFVSMHDGAFAGFVVAATAIDQSWQIKAVADVNNDGFADLIFQQTTTGDTVFAAEGLNGFDHWGTIQTPPGTGFHVV